MHPSLPSSAGASLLLGMIERWKCDFAALEFSLTLMQSTLVEPE
jgi:hypothetical protein